jgi:hypothetical protein
MEKIFLLAFSDESAEAAGLALSTGEEVDIPTFREHHCLTRIAFRSYLDDLWVLKGYGLIDTLGEANSLDC